MARLAVFEKLYHPGSSAAPSVRIGHQKDIPGDIFQNDPALRLQTLLPIDPAFDMAVNIFTYDSGGHLPQVEIHVMEHGLLMLAGTGIYRLGDEWFLGASRRCDLDGLALPAMVRGDWQTTGAVFVLQRHSPRSIRPKTNSSQPLIER